LINTCRPFEIPSTKIAKNKTPIIAATYFIYKKRDAKKEKKENKVGHDGERRKNTKRTAGAIDEQLAVQYLSGTVERPSHKVQIQARLSSAA